MRYTVRESEVAEQCIIEAAAYIMSQGQPAAADRLLVSYAEALRSLGEWPLLGHPLESDHPRLVDIRVLRIARYNLLIYYVVREPYVDIVATFHASRGIAFIEEMLSRFT